MHKSSTLFSRLANTFAACLVLLVLASCAVNPVTGRSELMLVSESEEMSIGDKMYPNALWGEIGGGGTYNDEKLTNYLGEIVQDIQKSSHRPHLPVTFAIQNSSVPNAWALPGHVVITRGLLAGLESEAEFTFVMGHEIGHVSARHTARQLSYNMLQSVGLAAAGAALQGSGYGGAALQAGAAGSQLLLLKFGRDDELEADWLGVTYMTRLGYDPDNAVSAHRNLEKVADEYMKSVGAGSREGGFFEELLSTHPRSEVRIEEIEKLQGPVEPRQLKGDGTLRQPFMDKTSSLRKSDKVYRLYYDKAIRAFGKKDLKGAEGLVDKAIEAGPEQPPFHMLKGYIEIMNKDFAAAEKSLKRSIALDPGYEPALRGLGSLYYVKKEYRLGIDNLTRALKIYPNDLVAHYYLGMNHFGAEDYEKALPYLKIFAEVQPKDPEIHYYLGRCFELTDDLRSAYNEYVVQVNISPSNEEGKLAAKRLEYLRSLTE